MNDMTKPPGKDLAPAKLQLSPVSDSGEFALLLDSDRFAQIQRVAKLYSESDFVTDAFRGKVANCAIALQSAMRLRVDPVMLMQHSYLVHGKPGMEGQLVIALVNARGPFTGPLQWKTDGEGDARSWTCYATHRVTGELCQRTVTWAIAKAEGWTDKPGSKWKTMPDQMGCYRSASWFARLYCPEVLLGFPTVDELEDIGQGHERVVLGEHEIKMPRAREPKHEPQTAEPATERTEATSAAEPAQTTIDTSTGEIVDTREAKPEGTIPPDMNRKASDAQKTTIINIAKRGGLSVAQLDERLVERFSMGIDELPMAMVNEAISVARGKA